MSTKTVRPATEYEDDPDFPRKTEAEMQADNEAETHSVSGSFVEDPELARLLAAPASKPWIPKAGDGIAGKVIDLQEAESEYGTYPLLEIDCGSRTLSVHCYHTTLANEIVRRKVKVGDRIAIGYLGEKASKTPGHNPFHQYRVIHRPSSDPTLF